MTLPPPGRLYKVISSNSYGTRVILLLIRCYAVDDLWRGKSVSFDGIWHMEHDMIDRTWSLKTYIFNHVRPLQSNIFEGI